MVPKVTNSEYYHYNETTKEYTKQFCFDEADRNVLKYEDVDEIIPNIPEVTVWSAGWSSGYVLSFLGYILLTEKVGVHANIWPTHDPSEYWNLDTTYPQSMADWFANGDMDLAFAMGKSWSVDDIHTMIQESKLAKATNGVIETQAFLVPHYLFERLPESALYTTWINDEDFRKMIIDDIEPYSGISYNGSSTKIQVIAPFESWAGVQVLVALSEYHNMNLEWVFTENEAVYAEKVIEMYGNEVDFLVYTYSPSYLNAVVNLQTVMFPDNPSKQSDDQCREENWCEPADDQYWNMWRETDVIRDWDEIREFMMRFSLDRVSEEEVMALAYSGRFTSGDMFVWNAACEWLTNPNNTEVWRDWIPTVTRHKCIGGVCDDGISTLQLILFLLAGFLGLCLILWIGYKISKICMSFQEEFGDATNLNELQKIRRQQTRKLFITMFSRMVALGIGLVDISSDMFAMYTVIIDEVEYGKVFMWLYFAVWVIATFTSFIHIYVTIKNILEAMKELKHGIIVTNEITNRSHSLVLMVRGLALKKKELDRTVHGTAIDIFVGLFEDVPFLILNLYSMATTTTIANAILVSTLFSATNIGYKLNTIKGFFTTLEERQVVEDKIAAAKRKSQSSPANC